MAKLFANSRDPDQTPHSTASDVGLHLLPITLLWVSRLQWVNKMSTLSVVSQKKGEKGQLISRKIVKDAGKKVNDSAETEVPTCSIPPKNRILAFHASMPGPYNHPTTQFSQKGLKVIYIYIYAN